MEAVEQKRKDPGPSTDFGDIFDGSDDGRPTDNELSSTLKWIKVDTLNDSFGSVEDIKFAPYFKRYLLASCHQDSVVLVHTLQGYKRRIDNPKVIKIEDGKAMAMSVSWNKAQRQRRMLVIGASRKVDKQYQEVMLIYELIKFEWKLLDRWEGLKNGSKNCGLLDVSWAASFGRSTNRIAACGFSSVTVFKVSITTPAVAEATEESFGPSQLERVAVCVVPTFGSGAPMSCLWSYEVSLPGDNAQSGEKQRNSRSDPGRRGRRHLDDSEEL